MGTTVSNLRVGSHTFTAQAIDRAGNPRVQSLNFNVIYHFGGFLSPLKQNGVYNRGTTIPVQFQLTNSIGAVLFDIEEDGEVLTVASHIAAARRIKAMCTFHEVPAEIATLFEQINLFKAVLANIGAEQSSLVVEGKAPRIA
jgi:hypothetical protein